MSTQQLLLLLAYTIGMTIGQLLFKSAALSLSPSGASALTATGRILELGLNPHFIGAMSLYCLLSVLWVWILTFTPLSRAYPFVAVAFIITPLMSHFVFMESLGLKFYFGIFFISIGLTLVAR